MSRHNLHITPQARGLTVLLAVALAAAVASPTRAATFNLVNNDSPGEGFNDPVLGAARIGAFRHAMNIWGVWLGESFSGETVNVIAQMDPLGGSATSAILGQAGVTYIHRDFASPDPSFQTSTWYGSPLANHLAAADLLTAEHEVSATFNSDVDNAVVLGGIDWYYGMDASPGSDIDFVTVVLHEIGHGLNFFDLINSNGSFAYDGLPGIYDRSLVLGAADGTPLTPMKRNDRRKALISGDLYWSGADGVAGNDGARPEIYAPNPYESGSSISHLDEDTHGAELMSPYYSGADHMPGYIELGMLSDMGWAIHIPGDANLDSIVDIEDFFILKANFDQSGAWGDGDFTGDGLIDIQDFFLFKAYFDESLPFVTGDLPAGLALLEAQAVTVSLNDRTGLEFSIPEPSSAAILLTGLAVVVQRRRRK